jgi:hypothetical protein
MTNSIGPSIRQLSISADYPKLVVTSQDILLLVRILGNDDQTHTVLVVLTIASLHGGACPNLRNQHAYSQLTVSSSVGDSPSQARCLVLYYCT